MAELQGRPAAFEQLNLGFNRVFEYIIWNGFRIKCKRIITCANLIITGKLALFSTSEKKARTREIIHIRVGIDQSGNHLIIDTEV